MPEEQEQEPEYGYHYYVGVPQFIYVLWGWLGLPRQSTLYIKGEEQ